MRYLKTILLSAIIGLLGMQGMSAAPASGNTIRISFGPILIDQGSLDARDARGRVVKLTDMRNISVSSDNDDEITLRLLLAKPGLKVSFSGSVHFGSRTIACRLAPEPDANVVQFGSGLASGPRCDSLFDVASDTAVTLSTPGEWSSAGKNWYVKTTPVSTGKSPTTILRLRITRDYYKTKRGYDWYTPLDTSVFDRAPAGWCSWYFYGTNITESEMIKNADWLAKNLKQFGCEYVQLDDGYQAESWTAWNEKFPHGGKWLADQIHARGMKAGLWLTPFCNAEKELVDQHPDWYIHDEQGRTIKTFKYPYTIDASNPGVLDGWLKPLYHTLGDEWGYDYFKQDAQTDVVGLYHHVKLYRPDKRIGEAYRSGLKAIREAITPERFMLSCSGTAIEGLGIINGTRTGGDVGSDWMGTLAAYDATRTQVYLNNIAWFCDPDVVCVRPPLTLDQSRAWATMVGLTGQLFMSSDVMYKLPEERVEVLRRVYPVAKLMPMDLYPLSEKQMDTMDVRVARPFGSWDVVGLINWGEVPKYVKISPKSLGLPADVRGYHVYDFWNNRYLGVMGQSLTLDLQGTSCRVLSVCAVTDRPRVISTSRHITQGAIDLKSVKWDARRKVLSGESEVVGGDPYTVTLASSPAGTCYEMTGYSAKGAHARAESMGNAVKLTLDTPKSGIVKWQVAFDTTARHGKSPVVPSDLKAEMSGIDRAILKWSQPESASGSLRYIVTRNGEQLALTSESYYRDENLTNGSEYAYSVQAVDSTGRRSSAASTSLHVPSTRDVYLTELNPTYVRQGYGTLQTDKSVVGRPMSIGSVKYEHGLGTMPAWEVPARIAYKINGNYSRFEAEVGVDNTAQGNGSVTFEVWGDGKKLYDSGLVKGHEEPRKVSVDVSGVKTLELVVTNGGNGNFWDHSDWANPRLLASN